MLDLAKFREHVERVKAAINNTRSLKDIPRWITENTFIGGSPYSFKDHEFQEYIIASEDTEVNVMKCSQIGLSEVMARWVVGISYNFPNFKTIITFPFGGDANDFARTRIDPFISSSPALREAVNSQLNNSEIKQIFESLIYFRGTNGKTAALSIPADCIVSDEIDRSDPHVLTQYTSRLTHSPFKWRRNFSTPTVRGHGIDKLMQTSRRFVNLCKCHHCNEWFRPDFFQHVKIPGYDGDLKVLNKNTISRTRWLEAKLLCPKCGREPSLLPAHREYVQENLADLFDAKGIYVSPFDAPAIITPVSLLKAMVSYARISEFINQNLGQTSEDSAESMTLSDILQATKITDLSSEGVMHAMGCDMGLVCHIVVGRLALGSGEEGEPAERFVVVHRERVALAQFEKRLFELKRKYKVGITVCDSMPYVDLILRLQRADKNLFGGFYTSTKTPEVFRIKMVEEDQEKGKMPINLAMIKRDVALDELMSLFKRGEIIIQQQDDELEEDFQKHLLDMKRVQQLDLNFEWTYTWVKSSDATDHFHHALLYCYTAARLRGVLSRDVHIPGPLIKRFRVQERAEEMAGVTRLPGLFARG